MITPLDTDIQELTRNREAEHHARERRQQRRRIGISLLLFVAGMISVICNSVQQ